ncbi:copper homeostasis protein CutC [Sporolactobacillus terrae]|uniref:PF03932 family protein CutC n=1 Tax=Sporolactobacillus terrae TaxID=269673 RepID=A0A410DB46_9BACL|nr:copper homeostasis protein CutC [Sporolactobacillus terrae]QAA23320.1 copper homeostasis protein CutC [Sporolactobacillus terrae]QAA26292.1 copper homeostasis protein CutC [Sporolactobacillus terrae]UAK15385.1 copper homeostasis protein CutC [Sporolactobacillus terrae]BBN99730.1 copper homeostasis protein CutC [Sporolactobacillus terrae]
MTLIKEFCAENFTHVPKAIERGADRIELCDNLAVGGTTVSSGVMAHTVRFCHARNIPVMVMIRPRGGNFVFTRNEHCIMRADIDQASRFGADGVVFGCLTDQNQLDVGATADLIDAAFDLEITFHMAFDQLSHEDQFVAIDWLAARGVKRILTHGGPMDQPITHHVNHLRKLIHHAAGRLIILPGGGITTVNAAFVAQQLSVQEVHGTKIVPLP